MSRHILAVIDTAKDDNECCYRMLQDAKERLAYCRNAKQVEKLDEQVDILLRGMLANEIIITTGYEYLNQLKPVKSNKFKKFIKKILPVNPHKY